MNCKELKTYDSVSQKIADLDNMLFSVYQFFYENSEEWIMNALMVSDTFDEQNIISLRSYCFYFKEHRIEIRLGVKYFSVESEDKDFSSTIRVPNTLPEEDYWTKIYKLNKLIKNFIEDNK